MDMERLKKHLFIVFGAEHYNPLGIIRTLGENGIRPIAIILKGERRIASSSKYIHKLHMVETLEEGYDVLLNQYGQLKHKPFVLTSDDTITSFLDKRYDELKDRFYFNNAGESGRITRYMDKNEILLAAKECCLSVPQTYVVQKGDIPQGLIYPVITKALVPTFDNWKGDSFICRSETDLRQAYESIRSPRILIQTFIEKKNELCLDGFCVNHGKDMYVTIASNYKYILAEGYSSYMNVFPLQLDALRQAVADLFAKIGFEGIFSVEFLVDQNDDHAFLEINFRNSTWSYASTYTGMPLPILWAMGMLSQDAVKDCCKTFQPFDAVVEFSDYRTRVKTKQMGKFVWLKQIAGCPCKYYWGNGKDLAPFGQYLWGMLKRKLRLRA